MGPWLERASQIKSMWMQVVLRCSYDDTSHSHHRTTAFMAQLVVQRGCILPRATNLQRVAAGGDLTAW